MTLTTITIEVFGAKVEYVRTCTLVAEKRQSKHDLTGCEEIWVGRSITTPGTDLAIPISWVGSEVCYELGPAIHVHVAKVFNKDFPLRFGPDALRDASQGDFNGFMDDFTYQLYMYGSVVDDADIATRTQGTAYLPVMKTVTLEIEAITDPVFITGRY